MGGCVWGGGVGRRKMKEEKQCDFAKAATEVGSLFLAQRGVPRPAGRLAGGRLSVILLTSEDLVSPDCCFPSAKEIRARGGDIYTSGIVIFRMRDFS